MANKTDQERRWIYYKANSLLFAKRYMPAIPSRIVHALQIVLHEMLIMSQYESVTEAIKMLKQSEILSLGKIATLITLRNPGLGEKVRKHI